MSTRVLPLPAPASTRVAPSGAVTAARWASFRGARIGETSVGSRLMAGENSTPRRAPPAGSIGALTSGFPARAGRETPPAASAPGPPPPPPDPPPPLPPPPPPSQPHLHT